MALKNLGSRIVNADGSTTVYGMSGNALETIDTAGSTVFAAPDATGAATLPIWYAPALSDGYFQNILNNQQLFQTVAGDIKVFTLEAYESIWTTAEFKAFFAYAAQNNIKLGLVAPALVAGPGQTGYGIEGITLPGALVSFVSLVKQLGGTLSYVGWDEPWYYGSGSTGLFTADQVAAQVAKSASAVRAIFPNVQIGDIEPVGGTTATAAALQAWFSTYTRVAGSSFQSFEADVQTWVPGWQNDLAATITNAHAEAMSVGVVIDGLGAADNAAAWAAQAVANAQLILSTPALRPDFLVVQSWQTTPSQVADPTIAGTLASVAADISAGESAALAIPATARYDVSGVLQSVTWTSGWTALRMDGGVELLSPAGKIVRQIGWSDLGQFTFDPNTATASLTFRTLTSALGAVPAWRTDLLSIGASGILPAAAPVPAASVTLGLAAASQTGLAGSGITNQSKPTLSGVAKPGAAVLLQVDGISAGSATAGATGAWSFTLTSSLSDGAHTVQAGLTGDTAKQVYIVSVDTAKPARPTLALAPGSDSGYAGDDITDVVQPVFAGVADPFTTITIAIDGKAPANVETDAKGKWSYDLNTALAAGSHTVVATASNLAGTSSAATTLQLTIDTAAQEALETSPDPLFDPAWYMQQHPGVASSAAGAYAQFMATGWKEGFDPNPFFSIGYYVNTYPDVASANINPLTHYEQYGWREGRSPAPGDTAMALNGTQASGNPLAAMIKGLQYTDALYTAVPDAKLAVTLLHDTGSSSTDTITDNPVLAITADPGATILLSVGTLTPTSFTMGSSGSWSYAYAADSLADGVYAVSVTQTDPGGATSKASTAFTLDRTSPVVTATTISAPGTSLGVGAAAKINLSLSEAVQVTGTPTLALNDGGVAQYTSGSGSKTLTFTYTVLAGQNTSALAVTGATVPTGSSLADAAGNTVDFTGAAAPTSPIAVKTQAATAAGSLTMSTVPITASNIQAATGLLGPAELQFLALPSVAFPGLSAAQIGSLPMPVVALLSAQQFSAISPSAIPGLTSSDLLALSPAELGAFTSAQLPALNVANLAAAVAGGFHSSAFTPVQLSYLTAAEHAVLFPKIS